MDDLPEHEQMGMILAMMFLAWSDRSLAESELALIESEAQKGGFDEEELIPLFEAVHHSLTPEVIVSYLPSIESRKAAAIGAYMVALADHSLSNVELEAFDALCRALEIPEEERDEIRSFGERELYLAQTHNWRDALLLERLDTT